MATGVELYEALRATVGDQAARMIAEALPMNDEIATKSDIEGLRSEVDVFRSVLRSDFDALRSAVRSDLERSEDRMSARLSGMEARIFRWMLGFFATLWVSNAALIVTLLVKR